VNDSAGSNRTASTNLSKETTNANWGQSHAVAKPHSTNHRSHISELHHRILLTNPRKKKEFREKSDNISTTSSNRQVKEKKKKKERNPDREIALKRHDRERECRCGRRERIDDL
jgi:hypothetical protein